MILARLDLIAYGRFAGVSLDLSAGPRRFHLIYGPNESGKSTSLRAITSLLFGMSHAADDCFLHNSAQVRVGGRLVDATTGTTLECIRRRGRKGTLRDAEDLNPIDESVMQSMIGGIDRENFLSRFGLSYEALVKGGTAIVKGSGDLGQILFAAGAGLGRLREIQSALEEEASDLYLPRGTKSRINIALKQLDDDRRARDQAKVASAEYEALQGKLTSHLQESNSLDRQLRDCTAKLVHLKNLQQALPLIPAWNSANEAFAEVASAPDLDDEFVERRRQASIDLGVASRELDTIQSTIDGLTQQITSIDADPIVMHHSEEIESAFQEISAQRQADEERIESLRAQRALDSQIAALLQQLTGPSELTETIGPQPDTDSNSKDSITLDRLQISDPTRAAIHDLAAKYAGLTSRRDDAQERLVACKRRLADMVAELENLGPVPDPGPLGNAIDSLGNPEADQQLLIECRQNGDTLRQQCLSLLKRLTGFDGDLEQASALALPDEVSLKTLEDSQREWSQTLEGFDKSLRDLQEERKETQAKLDDLRTDGLLPTIEELQRIRQQRDTALDELATGESDARALSSGIHELRRRIDAVDRVADTMYEQAQRIHQRAALASQLRRLDERIDSAQPTILQARSMLDNLRGQWSRLWQDCGILAGSPEQMQRWRTHHAKLCLLVEQLKSEENKLEQIHSRIDRTRRKLRLAMERAASTSSVSATPSGFASDSTGEAFEQDVCELFDAAIALRSQWTQEVQDRQELQRRRQSWEEELPVLEARYESAERALLQWHQDWERLTQPFLEANRAGITEVLEMLDEIRQLDSLKQRRRELADRLSSIDEDQQQFATRVRNLAEVIHQQVQTATAPVGLAKSMYQRLQKERESAQQRKSLDLQVNSAKQKQSTLVRTRTECQVVLKQLCKEAGCGTADELPEIERCARERRRLQSVLGELRSQLTLLAADQPLKVFLDEAATQQAGLLAADTEREQEREVVLRRQLELAHQEVGAVRNELNRIDGGSAASDLSQTIQMTAGSVRCDAEEYARLKIGALVLQRAIDHYRQENQSPVIMLANHYFQQLTCGDYIELRPDYNSDGVTTLFGIPRSGDPVPAAGMSTGTADALYLALRLASMQHQMQDGRTIPVVIDDCLIQLDDSRAVAALQAFSELSEQTQVILFTHHQHLCQLAAQHLKAKDFHLHRLDQESPRQASMLF